MCEYLKSLQKPFPAEDIEWRVSHAVKTQHGAKALVLAYVTNRAIMERLDEVFGIAGWKNEYTEWRDKGVKCTLTCKVGDEWIAKEDGADVTDMEATKGGFSASMKRTAVQWGIGRYLYNLDQTWVEIKERGQNYINTSVGPKDKKEWVKGYWDTPKLPQWALPEGYEPRETKPQLQEPEPTAYDEDTMPSDDDLNNLQDTPPAQPKAQPTQPQRQETSAAVAARVYKIREEMGWTWPQLTEYCQDVLNRPVKFLKKDITDIADWKKIEELLNDYRRKAG